MFQWAKRKHERHRVNVQVGIDAGSASPLKGHILKTYDISVDGAFIIADSQVDVGTKVLVRTLLPSGTRTVIPGIVWRISSSGMAVRFEHICKEISNEFDAPQNLAARLLPSNDDSTLAIQ